jgi:DNA-binding response OmpR family regulator
MSRYKELKACSVPQLIHFGNLTLDSKMGEWTIGEQLIKLSSVQTTIIKALMLAKGEICLRQKLLDAYGAGNISDRSVDAIIRTIRGKIKKAKLQDPIVTSYAGGYQLWSEEMNHKEILNTVINPPAVLINEQKLILYPTYQLLRFQEHIIPLNFSETAIIKALMKSGNKKATRMYLLKVTRVRPNSDIRALDTIIKRMRRKITPILGFDFIATEHGEGYRLNLYPCASKPKQKPGKINPVNTNG